jgi:hypothetical protein
LWRDICRFGRRWGISWFRGWGSICWLGGRWCIGRLRSRGIGRLRSRGIGRLRSRGIGRLRGRGIGWVMSRGIRCHRPGWELKWVSWHRILIASRFTRSSILGWGRSIGS